MSLVLADNSVRVAHFRSARPVLQSLLAMDQVLCHPLIGPELACGTPPASRESTLGDLKKLRQAIVATTDEILALIETKPFRDSGCGAEDMTLLASVVLSPDTLLWTIDKNLVTMAARLGIASTAPGHWPPKPGIKARCRLTGACSESAYESGHALAIDDMRCPVGGHEFTGVLSSAASSRGVIFARAFASEIFGAVTRPARANAGLIVYADSPLPALKQVCVRDILSGCGAEASGVESTGAARKCSRPSANFTIDRHARAASNRDCRRHNDIASFPRVWRNTC